MPIVENQMEKNVENDMEAGLRYGVITCKPQLPYCIASFVMPPILNSHLWGIV